MSDTFDHEGDAYAQLGFEDGIDAFEIMQAQMLEKKRENESLKKQIALIQEQNHALRSEIQKLQAKIEIMGGSDE